MGKMPVLWSMVVLKRIHPIPQSLLLLPYLEKVCDGSNPGFPAGPLCNQRMLGRKAMGAGVRHPQTRNVRRHQKLKQEQLSQGLQREPAPLFQTAGLPNSETIYFYCFKLPSLG